MTEHGTLGGYKNRQCRCPECKAANAAFVKAWRSMKRPHMLKGWEHGTRRAYEDYGCRCEECAGEHAARQKARREPEPKPG